MKKIKLNGSSNLFRSNKLNKKRKKVRLNNNNNNLLKSHKPLNKKRKVKKVIKRDEYISLVARQLEYIPSHVVVERLTGDAPLEELVAPLWSIKKTTILNDIDKYMKAHDIMQGDLVSLK